MRGAVCFVAAAHRVQQGFAYLDSAAVVRSSLLLVLLVVSSAAFIACREIRAIKSPTLPSRWRMPCRRRPTR
jgi:hypothetical protein